VIELSRGTQAEKLIATRIEQRYIVRPLGASDWQIQVQTSCTAMDF
jgi:hypothetical protein